MVSLGEGSLLQRQTARASHGPVASVPLTMTRRLSVSACVVTLAAIWGLGGPVRAAGQSAASTTAAPKPTSGTAPSSKTTPAAKTASSTTTATHPATATHTTTAHPTSTTATKTSTVRRRRRTTRFVPRQKAPTPDRISEIQTALSHDGYFQGQPNGKWDASTIAALQKFQSAHGLEATGKLDAPSLQKMGLGSDIAGVSAPRPPAPAGIVPQSATPSPSAPAASGPSSGAASNSPGAGSSGVAAPGTTTAASINPSAGSLASKPQQ